METIDGVPVTDEMIQEWADEAERGYDVEALRQRSAAIVVEPTDTA
ncbi:toxin-antitoxin system antitoxin subunit [Actinomyces sp. ZJ308]|nr:toxin-antitoxin system antitoxin subunit [Actinomyces sp. ZJ308]